MTEDRAQKEIEENINQCDKDPKIQPGVDAHGGIVKPKILIWRLELLQC